MNFSGSRQRQHINVFPAALRRSVRRPIHAPTGTWRLGWWSLSLGHHIAASRGPGFRPLGSAWHVPSRRMARSYTSFSKKRIPSYPRQLTSPYFLSLLHIEGKVIRALGTSPWTRLFYIHGKSPSTWGGGFITPPGILSLEQTSVKELIICLKTNHSYI